MQGINSFVGFPLYIIRNNKNKNKIKNDFSKIIKTQKDNDVLSKI
jgi:hypothetical protein